MKLTALACILTLTLAQPVFAEKVVYVRDGIDGSVTFTYDDSKISKERFEQVIQLAETNIYIWFNLDVLESCYDSPEYFTCDTRDWKAQYFFTNALVNTGKIRDKLIQLKSIDAPAELKPVVGYFERQIRYWLWAQESRINFYRSWASRDLRKPLGPIDPSSQCDAVFQKMETTSDKDALYKLAQHDWHNCVNQRAGQFTGGYPAEAWKSFLTKYGIQMETVIRKGE